MKNTHRSTEELLQELIRSRGLDYLREGSGKFFVNAFAEMGGEKQDVRLLRYLTEFGVHEDLLDAASLTPAMQRAYYSQAVQKLCDKAVITEELSHRICSIFWQAAYHTEPPVARQKPDETPISKRTLVPKSAQTAEELYQCGMRYFKAPNLTLQQWWPDAVKCLEAAATQNHLEAQMQLGFMYHWYEAKNELGIQDADAKSAFWFRKAAEQGNTNAQVHLSRYYRDGSGVVQDYDQALYWCHKAAEQGYTVAMNELRYLYGYRLNKPQLALEWCKKAAELGSVECQWRLGTMYEEGFGTDTDYEKALYWYRKAAVQGDKSAADRIPWVERQLKEVKSIGVSFDSCGSPNQDPSTESIACELETETHNQDPLRVWKSILKGLSIFQIVLSIPGIILAVILSIVQKEWTTALFSFAHIFYIYGAKLTPEIKKQSPWHCIPAVFLLVLALVLYLILIVTAASGDWIMLAVAFCVGGSAPLLARFGLETLIGCRLKESEEGEMT